MCAPSSIANRNNLQVNSKSNAKLESNPNLTDYYIATIKPQILRAFRQDPTLEWVSFTLLDSGDTHVLHIGAADRTDPGWQSFKSVIEPVVQKSPKTVRIEITDELLTELAGIVQSCPLRPFILGNSIAVTDHKLPGTLGGYVTAETHNGPVRFPFPRSSRFRILIDLFSGSTA